jgi:ubiquinone/menaquinone biosynthesis C-methylase UbiE
MASGDHAGAADTASHWVRWHAPYEDPASNLSRRLSSVQSMVRAALDELPARVPAAGPTISPEPIRVVSLCAGQGRDVIDVVATHPRGPEVSALLVELHPDLVAFARDRAAAAGVSGRIRVVEGDASQSRWYAGYVPADIVLVCGVFGNISARDITCTIQSMRGFCAPGGHVVWTRHRRPPDLTVAVRADFATAGFTELAFDAPQDTVMAVGHHRLDGPPAPFDPDQVLFDFVGDGFAPA